MWIKFLIKSLLLLGFSSSGNHITRFQSKCSYHNRWDATKADKKTAAEFSFFLAVPTLAGAFLKSMWDAYKHNSRNY